ncbi:LysM peptidoglycan-binding domain-containing protein [Motilibacter aurantiacus]|uniref:LysM peptidoglycan-binding domain-containing protein n=1 Tax=Motilibacter aurantiacus TaxID=2714955 RepID=UPI00140BAA05|nr:LysM peptidoglycan-binding domain-containing protein [Motilibacter aurantiacus]NHC44520.1 LysM peptidoglycan-binding domain-containing protein [Motilibacter aurantiacus]
MTALTIAPRTLPRQQHTRAHLRLTTRGKAVIVLALALVALLALSWGRGGGVQASSISAGPATAYVSVEPGDTLWAIALRAAPGDDPRDTVDRILDLNAMTTTQLQPGQRLIVPAS